MEAIPEASSVDNSPWITSLGEKCSRSNFDFVNNYIKIKTEFQGKFMINDKKIGIALGSGGARGLAHIGVLNVLKREGLEIDMVAGVSMGAVIGAYYALGKDLKDIEKEIIDFSKRKAVAKLVDLGSPNKSILKGKKAYKYINKLFGNAGFSDTKIPFQVIATDLESGDEVILKRGNIAKAVQASISIPGIFPPVKMKGKYLIDGGVVNPTPVDTVKDMGADFIIGVDLTMKKAVKLENPGMFRVLMQSYEIMRTQAAKLKMEKAREKVVLIKPEIYRIVDSFKFRNVNKFIEFGEEAAEKMLPEIKKRLNI